MTEKLKKQIAKQEEKVKAEEKKLKELKEKFRQEQEKDIYLKIPEKEIMITTKLQFKGKTYPEILKEVDESKIADYNLLQELRNEGFKSGWKKYGFLEDFWAFVPNPDEVSKSNNYVARFVAGSGYAVLYCCCDSGDSNSALGVFLVKKILKKNESKKNKRKHN